MFFNKTNNFSKFSDEDLIERYRHSHDGKYLGHLYMRYMHLVLGLCFKYFKNESLANDGVMDIYEIIAKELRKHNVENFKSWLYTVSKNYCLQEKRKDKTIAKKQDAFEIFLNNSMENNQELHLIEREQKEELLLKLEAALPTLKEQQQICIRAFYIENKSYQEIADELNIKLMEVKSNIQNGKRNLKIKMTEK